MSHIDLRHFRTPNTAFIEIGIGDGTGTVKAINARFPDLHIIESSGSLPDNVQSTIQSEMARIQCNSDVKLYAGDPSLGIASILAASKRTYHVIFLKYAATPLAPILEAIATHFQIKLRSPIIFIENLNAFQPGMSQEQVQKAIRAISSQYEFSTNDDGIFTAIPKWWTRGSAYPAAEKA